MSTQQGMIMKQLMWPFLQAGLGILAAPVAPLVLVGTFLGAANSALICSSILETRIVYDQVTDVRRVLDTFIEQNQCFYKALEASLGQTNTHLQKLYDQLVRIESKVDQIMDEFTNERQQKLIKLLHKTERAFRDLRDGGPRACNAIS